VLLKTKARKKVKSYSAETAAKETPVVLWEIAWWRQYNDHQLHPRKLDLNK